MTRYRQDHSPYDTTVKLGIKELLNKEQTGFKEFFTDYQPFYTINLLLNKELWQPRKCQNEIVKIRKKKGLYKIFGLILGFYTKKRP